MFHTVIHVLCEITITLAAVKYLMPDIQILCEIIAKAIADIKRKEEDFKIEKREERNQE